MQAYNKFALMNLFESARNGTKYALSFQIIGRARCSSEVQFFDLRVFDR